MLDNLSFNIYNNSPVFVLIGASIGFDRAEYDVLENAMFSNVTIRLTGMIDREIVVRVTTQDGSAVCK